MGVLDLEEPPILMDNGVFGCESVEHLSLATNDNSGTKGFSTWWGRATKNFRIASDAWG